MKPNLSPHEILSNLIERDKHREEDWLAAIGLPKPLYDLFLRHPEELEVVRDVTKLIRNLEWDVERLGQELSEYRWRQPWKGNWIGEMVKEEKP